MEDRRLYLNPEHHVRRGKIFALLVILGLGVVVSVWFLQLRTLFGYGDSAEVNERVAAFQRDLESEWTALDDEHDEVAALNAAADAVAGYVQEEIINAEARDAVADQIAESLHGTTDATDPETTGTVEVGADTVTPETPDERVVE